MPTSHEKGLSLEHAAAAIQDMVLRLRPDIGQADFMIDRNFRFQPHGDRNEIDLLVRIRPGTPQETKHVFECRNRKNPVSKNDVIVLAAKKRDLDAQKATIVARRFSPDAVARAEHEGIELVHCTDEIWLPVQEFSARAFSIGFESFQVSVFRWNDSQPPPPQPDWQNANGLLGTRIVNFAEYARELAREWLREKTDALRGPIGVKVGSAKAGFQFSRGELQVGTWAIAHINIDFAYSISLRAAQLVSTFSIEKQGRFARFECEPDPFDQAKIGFEALGKP